MFEHYLPNKNEHATITSKSKFTRLKKGSVKFASFSAYTRHQNMVRALMASPSLSHVSALYVFVPMAHPLVALKACMLYPRGARVDL